MTYKPYSVVAVPFPFTDSPRTKKRPAVVLSSENHQSKTGHITLLMVTTAKNSHWFDDHPIIDLTAAGLNAPSIIRQKIFTIDIRLIIKKIGMLNDKDQNELNSILKKHLLGS